MTTQDLKRTKHLLTLADAASDFEFISPELVLHFHAMREDLGLAKLLLLVQEYAQNRPDSKTSEASEQNQNETVVQRV